MGPVVGDLLPLAVAVAISPVPIIAVILMLLAPKAGGTSAGFLVGWVLGIAGTTTLFVVLAGTLDSGSNSQPSAAVSWVKLGLGMVLLLLAGMQWRGRPEQGVEPALPKWMAAIDQFTAGKAVGLGLALAAVNPKNLLMCVAAGTTIAAGDLSGGQDVWSVLVFTLIAASTIAVPVAGYAVGRKRMAGPLESLHTWPVRGGVGRPHRRGAPLVLGSLRGYRISWLRPDLVAGVPPVVGHYAAAGGAWPGATADLITTAGRRVDGTGGSPVRPAPSSTGSAGLELRPSGHAAHLVAPDPATAPFWGALVSACLPPRVDHAAAPPRAERGGGAQPCGVLTHDRSLPFRRRTAPPTLRCVPRGSVAAPASAPSIAGVEHVLARASVSPSLTLTTPPLRVTPDPHVIATTRRRHVRIGLVLVVRRAERGSATGFTALPGRRPRASR
jgi:threonine/homoserine/homoserine lactone efflux protein